MPDWLKPFGIAGHGFGEHFNGDVAIQFGVARAIDFAHPARADGGEDFVGSDAGTGSHAQRGL